MRFVPTPVASKLTGLSTDKLREWTIRRALIPVDVRPKQKGSPAKFSWQTILVLRIAVLLRERFHVELQAHKASFFELRRDLHHRSFISLWGRQIAILPDQWMIAEEGAAFPTTDVLLIQLDPHLHVLRDGFALPDAATNREQLDLFSLPNLHRTGGSMSSTKTADVGGRRSA